MSDLTDDELSQIGRRFAGADHEESESMVAEIRRHRAAVRADRERVSRVTYEVVCEAVATHFESTSEEVDWIAVRVADALASPARMQIDTTKLLSSTTEAELANISTLSQMEIYDALHRGRMERIHAEDADQQRNARHYARDESTVSPVPTLTAERVMDAVRGAFTTVTKMGGDEFLQRHIELVATYTAHAIADRAADRLAGAAPSESAPPASPKRTREELARLIGENAADNYLSFDQPTGYSEAARGAVPTDALRGLQLVMSHLNDGGHEWTKEQMRDVHEAEEWLIAAHRKAP